MPRKNNQYGRFDALTNMYGDGAEMQNIVEILGNIASSVEAVEVMLQVLVYDKVNIFNKYNRLKKKYRRLKDKYKNLKSSLDESSATNEDDQGETYQKSYVGKSKERDENVEVTSDVKGNQQLSPSMCTPYNKPHQSCEPFVSIGDNSLRPAGRSKHLLIDVCESSSELDERESKARVLFESIKSSLIKEVKKKNMEKPKKDYASMAGLVRRRQINKVIDINSDSEQNENPNRVQNKMRQPNKMQTKIVEIDFSGRTLLTEKERLYIEYFLQEVHPQIHIIDNVDDETSMPVFRDDLLPIIRDEEINSVLLNSYLAMMNYESTIGCPNMYRQKIGYVRCEVQVCVLKMHSDGQSIPYGKELYKLKDSFGGSLRHFLRTSVDMITRAHCRYICVPLNSLRHWHLLVLDFKLKEIRHYNSLWEYNRDTLDAHAEYAATFFVRFFNMECKMAMPTSIIHVRRCRQQESGLGCGPMILYYAEELAGFRNFIQGGSEAWFRGHTAARLLVSDHCSLRDRMESYYQKHREKL